MSIKVSRYFKTNINKNIKKEVLKTAKQIETYLGNKEVYERMKKANKGKEPPQFMSTHPSSSKRIKNLKEWENGVIIDYPPIIIS